MRPRCPTLACNDGALATFSTPVPKVGEAEVALRVPRPGVALQIQEEPELLLSGEETQATEGNLHSLLWTCFCKTPHPESSVAGHIGVQRSLHLVGTPCSVLDTSLKLDAGRGEKSVKQIHC